MQNKFDLRKIRKSVHFQPLTERQERNQYKMMKNVVIKNLHFKSVQKSYRSYSVPHKLKFLYRFEKKKQKATDSEQSIRTPSKRLYDQLTINIVKDTKDKKQEKTKRLRRSCDCQRCGQRTIFQKTSMSYGVQIAQHLQQNQASLNKYRRSFRRSADKVLMIQSDQLPQLQVLNASPTKEIMINSLTHLEEEQILKSTSTIDPYIQKQTQQVQQDKKKFSYRRKLFDKLNFQSIPILDSKLVSPSILSPQLYPTTPSSLLPSPRKSIVRKDVNMYLKPRHSQFQKTHNRLLTLPELKHLIQ